jgi:hypothetical protein
MSVGVNKKSYNFFSFYFFFGDMKKKRDAEDGEAPPKRGKQTAPSSSGGSAGGSPQRGKQTAQSSSGGAAGASKTVTRVGREGQAWTMGSDKVKGRIVIATRDLEVGEVILDDTPLVVASWHAHRCIECHELHASSKCQQVASKYPKDLAARMDEVEEALGTIDGFDELDVSRRLIKLLNLARLEPERAELTRPCTANNMEKCRTVIRDIRAHKVARLILPATVEDEEAARLLAVLNTNSHELGEWGGSGFFPLACLFEHNCAPNCAFNTYGTDLWVTVVRPVREGDALSIDYCDATFEPTAARRAYLLQDYGFECTCDRCIKQPDVCRAFCCPAGGGRCGGKVCPIGLGNKPADWRCLTCGRQLPDIARKRYLKIEAALAEEGPVDLEEVEEVLEHNVFKESHHIIVDALVELGTLYAKDDELICNGSAEAIWNRVISLSQEVLPEVHPHKAIYYDNLAQVTESNLI